MIINHFMLDCLWRNIKHMVTSLTTRGSYADNLDWKEYVVSDSWLLNLKQEELI